MTSWSMIPTRNETASILSEDAGCKMRGAGTRQHVIPCPRIPNPASFVLSLETEPLI